MTRHIASAYLIALKGLGMLNDIKRRKIQGLSKTVGDGKYIIKKITIEVYGDCDKDKLDELVEKVKQNCPIYLSFNDEIVVVPRYNF
ncbi:MAG: hypothetical protein RXR43_00350 [Sulfolobus sp.]